jgi:CheY-like chemotaxis protein
MRKKILLVDDDEAVLDYLRAKIGGRYELVPTSSPASVLELVRQERPDLVLCDVDMPRMDGGDISAALFADDEVRHIPLLFITGVASADTLKRLSGQLGGRRVVSKSIAVPDLVAVIDSLIG